MESNKLISAGGKYCIIIQFRVFGFEKKLRWQDTLKQQYYKEILSEVACSSTSMSSEQVHSIVKNLL